MCLIPGFKMSFVIVYNIPGNCPTPHYILTGIIGENGSLHWLCTDVGNVLGVSYSTAKSWSDVRIKDVTGPLDNVKEIFLKRRIISHEKLTELMKNSKRHTVRDFEKKLNGKNTRIGVNPDGDPKNIQNPTYVVILDKPEADSKYFMVWLEFYKETVLTNLFKKIPVLDDEFVQSFCKYAEEPKQQEVVAKQLPKKIFYFYNGHVVTYVPEKH